MENLLKSAQTDLKKKAFEAASTKAHQVIKTEPLNSGAWHLLGLVALEQKNYQEAIGFIQKAIQNEAKALYYFNLGIAYRRSNQLKEAIDSYQACLKLDQNMARAWGNLGNIYRILNQPEKAKECYEQTLKIDPKNALAYYNLGIIYHVTERYDEAIQAYRKSIKFHPNHAKAHCNLGSVYSKLHRFKKSLSYYQKAIELDPHLFDAYNNLGGTYIELGEFEKAEDNLRKALKLKPDACPTLRNITLCKRYADPNDKDAQYILKLLKNPNLNEEDKIHLYFSLGKIYNDTAQHDKAMQFFQKGNTLHYQKYPFNIFSLQDYIRDIVEVFDESFVISHKNLAQSNIQPLLILGAPRSGKSLVERLLKAHPELEGVGEVGMAEYASKWETKKRVEHFPKWVKEINSEMAQSILDRYENRMLVDTHQRTYMMDTMPGNAFYLGLYGVLFSNFKVISLTRDPEDLGLFMYFKYFVTKHYYAYDLHTIGQFCKLYSYLMDHWKQVFSHNILEIHYEDLVAQPKKTLDQILDFLKLDSMQLKDEPSFSTREVHHSKNYETYLKPLREGLQFEPSKDEARFEEALKEATRKHRHKQYEEAAKLYRYVLEHEPSNPVPVHLLGVIAFETGHDEKAIELISKALEMNPNYGQAHNNLGVVLLKNNRKSEAEKHFKLADSIQEATDTEKYKKFTPEHRETLNSAFSKEFPVIKEHERKILYKGKVKQDSETSSYLTQSWYPYFKDLSYGSMREGGNSQTSEWRMRSWHFLYKNLAVVDKIFNDAKNELKILDVGCAMAYFRRFLEGNISPSDKKSIYYWGLDSREELLEKAVTGTTYLESGAAGNYSPSAFIMHDIEEGLPFQDAFFDVIINFEMIKYLPLKVGVQLIYEMHRVLKPSGMLYLTTSYQPESKALMEGMSYDKQLELLQNKGFTLEGAYGVDAKSAELEKGIKPEHQALYQALCGYHPKEMAAAFVTPLYPELAAQRIFYLKKT